METQEQIERIEHFIREVIVDEITKLQGVGLSYMQFVIMGQAIEVLGSFLDNKPMRAKGQSAKRFSLGVKRAAKHFMKILENLTNLKNVIPPLLHHHILCAMMQ